MFERYTEKARRVIFFARYEASQFGGQYIETSHLLLGLLREDRVGLRGLLRDDELFENAAVLLGLEASAEKVSTSIDIPLSYEAKRVLACAAEEATRLDQRHIGSYHLLLGLLREPGRVRDLLEQYGLQLSTVREAAAVVVAEPRKQPPTGDLLEMLSAIRGAAVVVRPANEQIVADLRAQFGAMMERLTPELEPAVVYSARAEKAR